MSYRTHRSARHRYWCRTELTEMSGTGIDVVPVPVPAPVQIWVHIPAVYVQSGFLRRYPSGSSLYAVQKIPFGLSPEKEVKNKNRGSLLDRERRQRICISYIDCNLLNHCSCFAWWKRYCVRTYIHYEWNNKIRKIAMHTSQKASQSDIAKIGGIKSDWRIRWAKSSDFGPKSGKKSDDSVHWIIKSKKGISL